MVVPGHSVEAVEEPSQFVSLELSESFFTLERVQVKGIKDFSLQVSSVVAITAVKSGKTASWMPA